MKNAFARMLPVVLSVAICSLPSQVWNAQSRPKTDEKKVERVYDGNWWLSSGSDERSGFLDGAGDCLFWVAHPKWLSRSMDGLDQHIDQYYRTHPGDRSVSVSTVWRRVLATAPPNKPRPPGGEVWTNPHGYYDGTWWAEGSELGKQGFLEGYLWCMRACVTDASEKYSLSTTYYARQISAYIRAHPKAYNEPIATILSRFRDKAPHE